MFKVTISGRLTKNPDKLKDTSDGKKAGFISIAVDSFSKGEKITMFQSVWVKSTDKFFENMTKGRPVVCVCNAIPDTNDGITLIASDVQFF